LPSSASPKEAFGEGEASVFTNASPLQPSPGICPGRADCNRLDHSLLCAGCEFENDSWGKWPEWVDWSKVEGEWAKERRGDAFADSSKCIAHNVSIDEWIKHLFWLWRKKEAGCRFSLNDLSAREWEGLEIANEEIERLRGTDLTADH